VGSTLAALKAALPVVCRGNSEVKAICDVEDETETNGTEFSVVVGRITGIRLVATVAADGSLLPPDRRLAASG